MFGFGKNRLLKKIAEKINAHPIPFIPPKEDNSVSIAVVDAIVRDWVHEHICPDAQIAANLVGYNVNQWFEANGWKLVNDQTWHARNMPMYVKQDKDSEMVVNKNIPWVGN